MAVAKELARYKLDLVGVQEVRWDKGGTVRAGDYNGSVNVLYSLPNIVQVIKSRTL
jgi:hypothetical protein